MRRIIGLVIFLVLFFYLALVYDSRAFLLLFFSAVILSVLIAIANVASCIFLQVDCLVPYRTVYLGEPIPVEVQLESFYIPSGRVTIQLKCRGIMDGSVQKRKLSAHALAEEEQVFTTFFEGSRIGFYTVQMTKVKVFDYLGILELPKFFHREKYHVFVLPEIYPLCVNLSEKYSVTVQSGAVLQGTSDGEKTQVREYIPGDSLRDIHWKLTAKKEQLMVREESHADGCGIHLLLTLGQVRGEEELASYLQLAVSISQGLLNGGNTHYIAWYDYRGKKLQCELLSEKGQTGNLLRHLVRNYMLQEAKKSMDVDLAEMYREQYQLYDIPCFLEVDENLTFWMNGEKVIHFESQELKRQLKEAEINL